MNKVEKSVKSINLCLRSSNPQTDSVNELDSPSAGAKIIQLFSMAARPLVLCGPSGVGKSTLVARLTKEYPDAFGFSVSHTTRGPRPGEQEGVSYHYVSREDMVMAIGNDEFIENAEFSGNMYGTSKAAVQSVMDQGRICILDIVSISLLLLLLAFWCNYLAFFRTRKA